MRYEDFLKRVSQKYQVVVDEDGTYFLNEAGYAVAYENTQKNLLIMYVRANNIVSSADGFAAVAISKDFELTNKYRVRTADVVIINGLWVSSIIERYSSRLLISNLSDNLKVETNTIINIIEKYPDCYRNTKFISCMGSLYHTFTLKLDIGIALDLSPLFSTSYRGSGFENTELRYGILCYKRKRRKFILPEEYEVFKYLRERESWHCGTGYDNVGSPKVRAKIDSLASGTNYHIAKKVTCTILN